MRGGALGCLVARGWLDGYWERRLSPWDIAAGGLIVAEAGGTVTSTTNGTFDPHSGADTRREETLNDH